MMSTCRSSVLFIILTWAMAVSVQAREFYVDQNDPGASDRNSGSISQPWRTIARANNTLVAGDTVLIKAGTYDDATIAPVHSGTSDDRRITYRNFGDDVVIISNAVNQAIGLHLDAVFYVTVHGITFTQQHRFLHIVNGSSNNIVAYCNFDDARLTDGVVATWAGSSIRGNSQHNWIHHCRFSKYGYYNADDKGCVLDIGAESDKEDETRYNLLEDNAFFHGGHHVVGVYGKYNVIRNNSFHNEPWSMGTPESDRGAVLYGNRNLSFSGYSENGGRNLLEGNRVGYSSDPSDNRGASGAALNSSHNIVRRNAFFHNNSAGLSMSVTRSYLQSVKHNRVYHNTFYNNGHNHEDPTDHMSSGIGFGIYSGSHVVEGNAFKNNLLYAHRIPFGQYNINTTDRKGLIAAQEFAGNWDGDAQGDPLFVNALTEHGDPMDASVPDLRLRSDSPCRDKGTYLTTIVSPAGSGTSFVVADAGYFMDGWGIAGVQGDRIQLLGTPQSARITRVDYETHTVVVDKQLSWGRNQGVSLAYHGSAPDVGAYELEEEAESATPARPDVKAR